MKKFGQEVILTIEDEAGRQVLDASGLRVDFDVRYLEGFARGTVTIYNLTEETIGSLVGRQDRYATVKTRLHGKQEYTVMDRFYISNSIDEKKIPNTITTLYCYDSVKKDFLEQQVNLTVENPTLNAMISQMYSAIGYEGQIIYQSFPTRLFDYAPPRPRRVLEGSVNQMLIELGNEFGFYRYPSKSKTLFLYTPNLSQVGLTNLNEQQTLVLNTNNMRANPKLAPAQLQVVSNLDGEIEPGVVLDISNLLTAGVATDEQTLQLADNFARESLSGYSRYQTLTVQHKGSNYTSEWSTIATAVAPQRGVAMPTQTWWR